ncbi:MAG TPA: TIGR03013 family PEP-CTERM/XrtA system glycosyltransferase [Gammaproteobacteria bacterium]|nr:TIGR03013 family PEP-CTERM/XrtA system glycosyltransferase [Gammaproteobacteria bacterium]
MGTVRFFRHSTQFFRHYIPTEFVVLGVLEFFALTLSFYVGLELRFMRGDWEPHLGPLLPRALVFSVVMQLSLVALGAYQRQSRQSVEMLALRLGGALLLGLVALGMTYYIAPMFFLGRGALALAVLVAFFSLLVLRLLFYRIEDKRDMRPRVLVLGAGETAHLVRESVQEGELDGLNIVGYVPMPGDREIDEGAPLVDFGDSLIEFVEQQRIDQIVLAADDRRQGLPVQGLLDCKMSGIDVLDLPTFFERETGKIRIDILHPSWLYLSEGFRESAFRRLAKRLFDILVSLAMLPLVLPLMLLAAIAILVESGGKGPVLYRQTRVSENGRPFSICKFRSMRTDAEVDGKPVWAQKNDTRITRVGAILRKTRLDELPQLFNVLKGDMSFVGPRPERPEFVEQLAAAIPYYNERHRVKPGLTGWAQIRYPYGASEEDGRQKLQYDLYYVKNYSIFMDLLILLQTAEVVLLGKGAH